MSEVTAYHEAGHAFVAVMFGARVHSVTIEPDDDDGPDRFGDTQIEWPLNRFSPPDLAQKAVVVALAGPVAEMIYCGDPFHPGLIPEWKADWQEAWRVAAALVPNAPQRMAYLERAISQLYKLLYQDRHWAALAAIVDSLLAHERLDGNEIDQIVATWT